MTPELFQRKVERIRTRFEEAQVESLEDAKAALGGNHRTKSGAYKTAIILPDIVIKTGSGISEETLGFQKFLETAPELRPFFPLDASFEVENGGLLYPISIQERVELVEKRKPRYRTQWIRIVEKFAYRLKVHDMHEWNWGFRKNTWQPVLFDIGEYAHLRSPNRKTVMSAFTHYSSKFEELQSIEIIAEELARLSKTDISRPPRRLAWWGTLTNSGT